MDVRNRKLISWALNNKDFLKLKITSLSWPLRWLPSYFDFHVSITFEGIVYDGRGTDQDESVALVKALMESIERILISFNKLENSNGIAVHFDEDKAKKAALSELIERDAFFCQYLSNQKYTLIKHSFFQQTVEKLKQKNILFYAFSLPSADESTSVLLLTSGLSYEKPFGLCIGLGNSNNFEDAVNRAMIECMRHTAGHLEGELLDNNKYTLDKFKFNKEVKVENHILLANNPNYGQMFLDLINFDMNERSAKVENLNVNFIKLLIPDYFKELNIHAVRADSDKLQKLYFGETTIDKVNFDRLSGYMGRRISIKDLNLIPHPLG